MNLEEKKQLELAHWEVDVYLPLKKMCQKKFEETKDEIWLDELKKLEESWGRMQEGIQAI